MTYAEEVARLARSLAAIMARQEVLAYDDMPAVVAARDGVVERLRALSGAVINVGPSGTEFAARHVATDPAHALHAALRDLPLASGPNRPPTIDLLARKGSGALPLWQAAARATALLEPYDEAVRLLPGPAAWRAARDIADLAATLPHIDADLARGLHQDSTASRAVLTEVGAHGAIRLAAGELLARVTNGPHLSPDIVPGYPTRTIRVQTLADLPDATRRLTANLNARAAELTATEARSTAKALAEGMEVAARALRAAAGHNPHFGAAAARLDRAVSAMRRIYLEPLETLTPPAAAIGCLADGIRDQLRGLGKLVDRLAAAECGAERDAALARAAAPALAWAMEVSGAAVALDDALRAAHQDRRLLSPMERPGPGRTSPYLWGRAHAPTDEAEPRAIAASGAAREAVSDSAALLERAAPQSSSALGPAPAERAGAALAAVHATAAERGRPPAAAPLPEHPRTRIGSRRRIEPPTSRLQNDVRRQGRNR